MRSHMAPKLQLPIRVMINFYLPGLNNNYMINKSIIDLLCSHPSLFHSGVRIAAVFGSFPNAIWNGGRTEIGLIDIERCKRIISELNSIGVAVRYTFTNSLLEKRHLDDVYCNLLMDIADNGKNEVLVNSKILEEYLRNKYPKFKYILSTTSLIRDIDQINKACSNYDMVVLDYRDIQRAEFLSTIKQKDKVELLVNESCALDCPMRQQHYEAISSAQLRFVEGEEASCKYNNNKKFGEAYISHDRIWKELIPMGFSHFKFKGRTENPILLTRDVVSILSPKDKQVEALTSILLKSYPF